MTYETDPVRWTHSLDDAPEALRAPLSACSKEGPNDLQMRTLALKLAAISAGTAVAATAATAHASTTAAGGAAASASAFSLAKVAVTLALVGAATAGVVVYKGREPSVKRQDKQGETRSPAATAALDVPTSSAGQQGERAREPAPVSPLEPRQPSVSAPAERAEVIELDEPSADAEVSPADAPVRKTAALRPRKGKRFGVRNAHRSVAKSELAREQTSSGGASAEAEADRPPSEIELLRKARAALAARPREAFSLTEEHRSHYPQGMFAQERDALAIEALMRAGEMDMARELATRFVRAHPSSPHAHRFREAMGIR